MNSVSSSVDAPSDFSKLGLRLARPFPNPFNPRTTIRFHLPQAGDFVLTIFSVDGRLVYEHRSRSHRAGWHEITWNAESFPSGLYLVRAESGGRKSAPIKLMLLK
ncbi:T9SS type A sorting domain-containing protein [bacterium]|nr:T9SS type A sorting domain-containing protein [bacterium]